MNLRKIHCYFSTINMTDLVQKTDYEVEDVLYHRERTPGELEYFVRWKVSEKENKYLFFAQIYFNIN